MFKLKLNLQNFTSKFSFNNSSKLLNVKSNSSINKKGYREQEGVNINVNTNVLKEKEVFALIKKKLIENKISQEIKPCLFWAKYARDEIEISAENHMSVAKQFKSLLNFTDRTELESIAEVSIKLMDHPVACKLALDKSYAEFMTKTSNPETHLFYDNSYQLGAVTPYLLNTGYYTDPFKYQVPLASPKNGDVLLVMSNNLKIKYNMDINWEEHFSDLEKEGLIKMYNFIENDYTLKGLLLDKSFENVVCKGADIGDYINLEKKLFELGYIILDKDKILWELFKKNLLE